MTVAELGSALVQRLKRPTIMWAVLVFYLLYIAVDAPRWFGHLKHPAAWVETFVTPLLLFASFAWLAPMPWQWDGRSEGRPSLRRGTIQAFLFIEALLGFQIWITVLIYRWMGKAIPLQSYLTQNLAVTAPLMMIFGCLVAIREAEESDKHNARSEARTAQTRLLQSQLHPHALFNALNGLAELIRKDPVKAENSVKSLSDLLRRLLVASEQGLVPLASERSMVEDYLDIEAMRLGDRLEIEWDWDPGLDGLRVIPLLVQPLVENAIKHGISPHIEGGRLLIRTARTEDAISVEVRNSGMALRPAPPGGGGIGMKNLAARLALAYGDKARFSLVSEADWVVARISISMSELRASEVSDARSAGR
jgi:two-component sensor histidine kinase